MVTKKQIRRKRERRKLARRREGIRKMVSKELTGSIFEEVLGRSKIRCENRWPIRWTMKVIGRCYVCGEDDKEIFSAKADNINYNYGWLCCEGCLPWVLKVFRPLHSKQENRVCVDSLQAFLNYKQEFYFTRRSRSIKNKPQYVQLGKVVEFYFRPKEKIRIGRIKEDRITVLVTWEDCKLGKCQKCVTLSNLIRTDSMFPQTVRELLSYFREGRTIISRRMLRTILYEYLMVSIWNKLENRLNSDVLSVYGWFSED